MAITIAGEVQGIGRRLSLRHRMRISQGLKRYWRSLRGDERAERIAVTGILLPGRRLSAEHRQRISESKKLYWEKRNSQASRR